MYIRNTWATRCLCVVLNRVLLTDSPSRCYAYTYVHNSIVHIHTCTYNACICVCIGQYTTRFSTICLEKVNLHMYIIYINWKCSNAYNTHTHRQTHRQTHSLTRQQNATLSCSHCGCWPVMLSRLRAWTKHRTQLRDIHTYILACVCVCVRVVCSLVCVCVCMRMRARVWLLKLCSCKMHIGYVHTYIHYENYVMLRYYTLYLQSLSVCFYCCCRFITVKLATILRATLGESFFFCYVFMHVWVSKRASSDICMRAW